MYTQLYKYRHYVLGTIIITTVFASMYGLVQQLGRMQANDTPTLLATQVAKQLDADQGLSSVNMGATNLAKDPIPFVIIYDKKGKAVGGSGYLDNKLAVIPKGVLEHAKSGKNNEVTWQPQSGVRIASVTVVAKDYYVLGGQSLESTENRATQLLKLTALGYGTSLAIMAIYIAISRVSRVQTTR